MKRAVSLLLFVVIIVFSYLIIITYNDNNSLKEKIITSESNLSSILDSYNQKWQTLETIKEEKKDKVQRLEDLKVWNQEILDYLK